MRVERMAKPDKKGVPPRVHFIDNMSRSFKNSMMILAREATSTDALQTTHFSCDSNTNDDAGSTTNKKDEENNLVIMRLRSHVIPLLITD
jgi:hypothetical protein